MSCTARVLGFVELALASLTLYDLLSFVSAVHLLFLHITQEII